MAGPRDWSPQETYVFSREPEPRYRPNGLWGLLGILLGAFSVVLPLGIAGSATGGGGWALTTAGISAVPIAVWYRRAGGGAVVPALAGTLGLIGTVLCSWSLAAAYFPTVVPAFPQLGSPFSVSAPADPTTPQVDVLPDGDAAAAAPDTVAAGAVDGPGTRVVPPFEQAAVVAPSHQLMQNLEYVAQTLETKLEGYVRTGTLPDTLTVGKDHSVSAGQAVLAHLAPYMTLTYSRSGNGYTFTVKDPESGASDRVKLG
ncbi:hypothetical protein [Leifsonia shinshuensis]